MLSPALVQVAATSSSSKGSPFGILVIIIPIGLLLLFMSRSSRKRNQQAGRVQAELLPGARVVTIGGLHATVHGVADDTVDLEIAPGVVSTYTRRAIAQVVPPASPLSDLVGDETAGGSDAEGAGEIPEDPGPSRDEI